jgi:hypothetical protein
MVIHCWSCRCQLGTICSSHTNTFDIVAQTVFWNQRQIWVGTHSAHTLLFVKNLWNWLRKFGFGGKSLELTVISNAKSKCQMHPFFLKAISPGKGGCLECQKCNYVSLSPGERCQFPPTLHYYKLPNYVCRFNNILVAQIPIRYKKAWSGLINCSLQFVLRIRADLPGFQKGRDIKAS